MKRKILTYLVGILMMGAGIVAMPTEVEALGGGNCGAPEILGFRPWYAGLCSGDTVDAEIQQPAEGDETDLTLFVWTIVLNVMFDLTLAVGYLALGFVIWGGFLYIMSQGDPGKAQKGKTTLTNAIIGTIIAMVASVAVNTIQMILQINTAEGLEQDPTLVASRISNIFSWAYTVAGVLAVIFIIKSGISYMMSQGDPSKTQKAQRELTFSIVGLVIVILAAAITTFVMSATGGALQ